jgi:hypothetical protein
MLPGVQRLVCFEEWHAFLRRAYAGSVMCRQQRRCQATAVMPVRPRRVKRPDSLVLETMRSAVLHAVAAVCAGHVPKLN